MNSSTIITEINSYMKQNNLNTNQLSKKLGINVGSVSYLLNGNRTLSVDQLDRITELLGYSKGHFYEKYIEEFLQVADPNWRRISPFLYHCAELGKLECIREVVSLLMEDLMYSTPLFEMAEELFMNQQYEAAKILYENVALSEKKQHSERLALCQYRLFKIRIGKDQSQNFKTAYQFEPYVDRLDEPLQLDALKDLANLYRSLAQWDLVEKYAHEMESKAKRIYFKEPRNEAEFQRIQSQLSRPLFVYIAYAKLLYADICDGKQEFQKALNFTYEYADLSWVKENDPEIVHWINLFKKWAEANIYANKLMGGNISILPDYVAYAQKHPEEILSVLFNILYAANRYQFDIDPILKEFSSEIEAYSNPQTDDVYESQVIPDYYSKFLYDLALYYLRKGDLENGYKYMMKGLDKPVIITNILKFAGLYEQYRYNVGH